MACEWGSFACAMGRQTRRSALCIRSIGRRSRAQLGGDRDAEAYDVGAQAGHRVFPSTLRLPKKPSAVLLVSGRCSFSRDRSFKISAKSCFPPGDDRFYLAPGQHKWRLECCRDDAR